MKIYVIICYFLCFFATSCSSVTFYADQKSNILLGRYDFEQSRPEIVEGKLEYYLFGIIPEAQKVDLKYESLKAVHYQKSNVALEVYRTYGDIAKSILSFGLYTPIHYKIIITGRKYENDVF